MTNPLQVCVATMRAEDSIKELLSDWGALSRDPLDMMIRVNTPEDNLGVIGSYNWLYMKSTSPLLLFLHDDVVLEEQDWDSRLIAEFADPKVGVVGFGGATRHGHPSLYKTPYHLEQLARFNYCSNTDDAELHGKRLVGSMEAAVLDGFALCVRRELLDRIPGWPAVAGGFHCYDYAICCAARRCGYRVRALGIRCHHLGGRTSTTPEYQEWAEKRGITDQKIHEISHRWIYDEYRDVLPYEVPRGQ